MCTTLRVNLQGGMDMRVCSMGFAVAVGRSMDGMGAWKAEYDLRDGMWKAAAADCCIVHPCMTSTACPGVLHGDLAELE